MAAAGGKAHAEILAGWVTSGRQRGDDPARAAKVVAGNAVGVRQW